MRRLAGASKVEKEKCMKIRGISAALAIAFALVGPATVLAGSPTDGVLGSPEAAATIIYAPNFVSSVTYGVAMSNAGDIVGTSYADPGCGPFCLPPLETVVWKAGVRIVLPPLPGYFGHHRHRHQQSGLDLGVRGLIRFSRGGGVEAGANLPHFLLQHLRGHRLGHPARHQHGFRSHGN